MDVTLESYKRLAHGLPLGLASSERSRKKQIEMAIRRVEPYPYGVRRGRNTYEIRFQPLGMQNNHLSHFKGIRCRIKNQFFGRHLHFETVQGFVENTVVGHTGMDAPFQHLAKSIEQAVID